MKFISDHYTERAFIVNGCLFHFQGTGGLLNVRILSDSAKGMDGQNWRVVV